MGSAVLGHARDAASLARMEFAWDDSRRAFTDAAEWFVATTALVGDRWDRPGLGEWDVRALVGHTSRSLLTVETYLARPAAAVVVASATDYFRATRAAAADPAVAARGYLPTRTFELAVHTTDLATALGLPPEVPATAAAQALHAVADLAVADGLAGPLLLAATGRPGLPEGFSVL